MRESVLGPKRLELYDRYTDYTSNLPASFILELGAILHVEKNLESDRPQSPLDHLHWNRDRARSSSIRPPWPQFTVTTEKERYIFATRTGEESSLWVGKLNSLLHGPPEPGVECELGI